MFIAPSPPKSTQAPLGAQCKSSSHYAPKGACGIGETLWSINIPPLAGLRTACARAMITVPIILLDELENIFLFKGYIELSQQH